MNSPAWKNKLFFGDNLKALREEIDDESVDLVYLDPPFNSNANYNILFAEKSGERSVAQITAFEDTWHWGRESEELYHEIVLAGGKLSDLLQAMRTFLGHSDMMAYIVMMAPRLVELRRVLKATGSLYLHCDPTASHYLKLLMDATFGPQNFRSEVTWKRTNVHSDSKSWSSVADTLLYYVRDAASVFTWNPIYQKHSEAHINSKYKSESGGRRYTLSDMTSPHPRPNMMYEWKGHESPQMGWRYSRETMERLDREGRVWYPSSKDKRPRLKRYLDEMNGTLLTNIWGDIPPLNSQAQERLGYPTQKPEALLERIIRASSNEGDIVLDPFCGCGTAISVAERLERRWIGIDITHLAIGLIRHRLRFAFQSQLAPYHVEGDPKDVESARALADIDRYKFESWALGLAEARPTRDRKKGADGGIDGQIPFFIDNSGTTKKAVVQIKSGHVNRSQIGDLNNARIREKAEVAIFVTLIPATTPMKNEANAAGFYEPPYSKKVLRVQILTIAELLSGIRPELPSVSAVDTYKKPPTRQKGKQPVQADLFRRA